LEEKQLLLEVGMKIYCEGMGLSRYTITRVTEKQAMAKIRDDGLEIKFDREVDPIYGFKAKGDKGYGYSTTYYYTETPELIAKWERNKLIRYFNNIDLSKLSVEQLKQILEIAGKESQKEKKA
jgi:hypothetical protein